ncbi:HAMP domain-containing histidine kinase [Streptomyces sp. NBC_01261]|uniref:sensor histidine kinase n=1 Tax=Streptomyces sp. NBC_01261 TaxID=2903802 RepID=UPI002E36FDDE|nr:HAMP domain-containing sensor histidine kinase [Streptomyces sp. NBC_01261]
MTSTVPGTDADAGSGSRSVRRSRFVATLRQRSLLIRLLAVSALVSVCSITATAWVVLNTTAVVLGEERGQALADDARIYDTLVGWAATHPDWSGVGSTVEQLGRRAGHRVVLTTEDGRTLADSDGAGTHAFQRPRDATATVNPLATDIELSEGTTSGTRTGETISIDPRAVGPFRLSAKDGRDLNGIAHRLTGCLQREGVLSRIEVLPSGRPRLVAAGASDGGSLGVSLCPVNVLDAPMPSEKAALSALNSLVDSCLRSRGVGLVRLTITGGWTSRTRTAPPASSVASCLTTSRAQQLAPYVAPAALLFVAGHGRTATTFFDLSTANRLRISEWAAAVLVITVTVTSLAGIRLAKPLRVLTSAAIRMEGGELSTRVPVRGQDEIARLSAAFNAMSERREQSETMRRAMTNDIAHELRTPVSNLRGWLEAVEDGIARPDADLVALLLGQAMQLQHIIDDLRDLAAAEAGELRLAPVPVRVADLLSTAARAARATADAQDVTLSVTADPSTVIDADPVRLRQTVDNLVSNAVRHTLAGGTITLRATVEHGKDSLARAPGVTADGQDRRSAFVLLTVSDTGCGIPAEELPHIFDRFWRSEKSRNRQSGGSGLGLAIVRRLVEAHGGTVTVVSTVGEGTTITLRLPSKARHVG